MAGVFALPPAVADTNQQVRDDQADPVVPATRLEDLAVGGIVAEEGDLGHDHRQDAAFTSCHQLLPIQGEARDPRGQDQDGPTNLIQ